MESGFYRGGRKSITNANIYISTSKAVRHSDWKPTSYSMRPAYIELSNLRIMNMGPHTLEELFFLYLASLFLLLPPVGFFPQLP